MPIQINDRIVLKNNLRGVVRYIGLVEGRTEEWVGIELEEAKGSNNGMIGGTRYFYCPENHGLFVKYERLTQKMTNIGDTFMNNSYTSNYRENSHMFNREVGHSFPTIKSNINNKDPDQTLFEYNKKDYPSYSGKNIFNDNSGFEDNKQQENLFENEENKKAKELLSTVLNKWNASLEVIRKSLKELQNKIDEINKRNEKRKANESERDKIIRLVDEMIETNKRNENKKLMELYSEFKELMGKYKIKVE